MKKAKKNLTMDMDLEIILSGKARKKSDLVLMAKKFKLTNKQAATIGGISERTYQRWKSNHLLSAKASEHLLKVREVYTSGMNLFSNDEQSFILWMKTPVPAMQFRVPVDMITSSIDECELLNSELIRMEYGILS